MFNVHGNRMNNDLLRNDGATFIASHGADALFANDHWFRGISLKVGPDGAVYMIDWYDKNACHRNQPEVWDRTNGRMYRVAYGKHAPRSTDIAGASDTDLIQYLGHENSWHVTMARKELQQRYGKTDIKQPKKKLVLAALRKVIDTQNDETYRLNVLWTLHALGGIDPAQALALLKDSQPSVRSWMVRLATESRNTPSEILAAFEEMANSERSLVVRRELASALQKIELAHRWKLTEALMAHHDSQYDKVIPLLIWYGVEPLVVSDTQRALKLVEKSHIPLVTSYIFRRAASSPETMPILVEALAQINDPKLAKQVVIELETALKSLGKVNMPKQWPEISAKLAASDDTQVRSAVQSISVKFGDRSIFPVLRKVLADSKGDIATRKRALSVLVQGKDQQAVPLLIGLLDQSALRLDALKALSNFDSNQIPAAILSHINKWNSAEQSTAVSTLCSRVSFATSLFDAMKAEAIPRSYATAVHIAQVQQLGNAELIKKVEAIWGSIRQTPAEKLKQIAALKKQLTANSLAMADRSAGRVVYNKTCGQCHQLFGQGAKVGPDLTGSNRKKLEYLLENMVDPNALVGKDYQTISIATADGHVVTGLIKEENDTAVVLQTVEEVVTIPKSEIDDRSQTSLSIMPEGQLKTLSKNQIRDLIAYLQNDYQIPLPGEGPVFNEQNSVVPGAIEGESLKVLKVDGGVAQSQSMITFVKSRWSGKSHLWWTGGKPGSTLLLEFSVSKTGKYEIFTVLTKAHDYGKVRLKIDSQNPGAEFDLYNTPDVINTGIVSLGMFELEAGKHQLGVEITGKHPEAVPAFMFGLDYLYLATPQATATK